jgi:DNA-binding NarL/FixJ family response regulator
MNAFNSPLKVVIVDDHFLFPLALESVIKPYDFLKVSAILTCGSELVAKMDDIQPDVVFMDIMMPIMDGFTATKIITTKYPTTKVVAITALEEGENVKKMMEAGAWGYITKGSQKKEYDELFSRILTDKKFISTNAAINYALFMNEKKEGESKETEPIVTPREIEIIRYIAQGYSDKQIASELNLSHRTIDAHKQKMMHKLGTRKSAEIVAIAYKMKWI